MKELKIFEFEMPMPSIWVYSTPIGRYEIHHIHYDNIYQIFDFKGNSLDEFPYSLARAKEIVYENFESIINQCLQKDYHYD